MIEYGINVPNRLECFSKSMYVEYLEHGDKVSKGGIIIQEERMDKDFDFIKPRWAQVKYKADDIKECEVGDWVLIKHGFWSSSIEAYINGEKHTLWYVPPKSIKKDGLLAVSKEKPKLLENYI